MKIRSTKMAFMLILIPLFLASTAVSAMAGKPTCQDPEKIRAMEQYYDVVREAAPGLPGYTVYRPADLSNGSYVNKFGKEYHHRWGHDKFPILVWSNGACTETNDGVLYFLTQVAAHGFVVVAFGEPDVHVGGNGKAEEDRMVKAIDWATSTPGHGGPTYFNQLDASKIATAGFSCGGVDAEYAAVIDPRVKTSIIMCSGFYPDLQPGQNPSMSGILAHSRGLIPDLYGPVMFIPGSPRDDQGSNWDMAFNNAAANFDLAEVPTVLAYRANTSHGGYFGSVSTAIQLQAVQAVVEWLDGILNGNEDALEWVIGPDGLSAVTDWTVASRNFDLF